MSDIYKKANQADQLKAIKKQALELLKYSDDNKEIEKYFEDNQIDLNEFVARRVRYLSIMSIAILFFIIFLIVFLCFLVVHVWGLRNKSMGIFQICAISFFIFLLFKKWDRMKKEKHTIEFYL